MEEEKEIDGRIDMDGGHRGKGGGNWMGRGPAVTFWDVLWKRDGVKVKKLHADSKAPRALLHNLASLTKALCINNLN